MSLETVSTWASFGGTLSVHQHVSDICECPMQFAVYTPAIAKDRTVPLIWFLSGLTCTWANVMEKSGLQRVAAELGVIVVAPDTSPRGEHVANDEAYDLGQGAGFYLSATEAPWTPHFSMDRYIIEELGELVFSEFNADPHRQGITGHSMGGHGALTMHLKHPSRFKSVSAFSPIAAPSQVPWGQKAFTAYLGDNKQKWRQYDASELVREHKSGAHILIDTGDSDQFLDEQLRPELFIEACKSAGQSLNYRLQPGYDHSYWFVASFMEDHLRHHAKALD